MAEREQMKPRKMVIDAGVVDRSWIYSPEPRLEGLLKMCKYIKWTNVESFDDLK